MIKTLDEARNYMFDRIQKVSWDPIDETEKAIVSTLLEEKFYEKIWDLVSEEEMEEIQGKDETELEWKLFYKIPNYVSTLEETVAEVLADYLSPSVDELQGTTDENEE